MCKRMLALLMVALLVVGAVFAGGGGETKKGEKKIQFVYGGSDAVGSLFDQTNFRMVELLRERGQGRIEVSWHPADQLGGDLDQIQSVIAGTQTFYGDVLDWLANWEKDFSVLGWGFTFRDRDHLQKFLKTDLFRQMAGEFEQKYNVKILGATATDARNLYSKTPIRDLKDIKDKKMRVPEIESYLRLWEALGTRPTRVTWAEVYMGLMQGVIDACEGPTTASYQAKMHEAAPNVTLTRHLQSTFFFLMNGAAYDSLPADLQKMVDDAALECLEYCNSEAERREKESIDQMRAEGANIITLNNVKEWQDQVASATAAMEDRGLWRKGLYNEIQKIK